MGLETGAVTTHPSHPHHYSKPQFFNLEGSNPTCYKPESYKLSGNNFGSANLATFNPESYKLSCYNSESIKDVSYNCEGSKIPCHNSESSKLGSYNSEGLKVGAYNSEGSKIPYRNSESSKFTGYNSESAKLAPFNSESSNNPYRNSESSKLAYNNSESSKLDFCNFESPKLVFFFCSQSSNNPCHNSESSQLASFNSESSNKPFHNSKCPKLVCYNFESSKLDSCNFKGSKPTIYNLDSSKLRCANPEGAYPELTEHGAERSIKLEVQEAHPFAPHSHPFLHHPLDNPHLPRLPYFHPHQHLHHHRQYDDFPPPHPPPERFKDRVEEGLSRCEEVRFSGHENNTSSNTHSGGFDRVTDNTFNSNNNNNERDENGNNNNNNNNNNNGNKLVNGYHDLPHPHHPHHPHPHESFHPHLHPHPECDSLPPPPPLRLSRSPPSLGHNSSPPPPNSGPGGHPPSQGYLGGPAPMSPRGQQCERGVGEPPGLRLPGPGQENGEMGEHGLLVAEGAFESQCNQRGAEVSCTRGGPGSAGGAGGGLEDPPGGCAGCGRRIVDRYYLQAVDKQWHVQCLTCADCHFRLDSELTCFARDGHIYCKEDYYRRFAIKRCSRCQLGISANELVMRAREQVFHLSCFCCSACNRTLTPGEEFGLRDNLIYCRTDYELIFQGDYIPSLSPGMGVPGLSPNPNGSVPFYNGVGAVQKGRPRKRKSPLPDGDGCNGLGLNGMDMSERPGDVLDREGYGHTPPRQKRVRTSFKHHQLRTMKSYFALNHNPDAKDLKQLAQKTGLSKRVLQVWFQNARAKYRRNLLKQQDSDKPGAGNVGSPGGQDSKDNGQKDGSGSITDMSNTRSPALSDISSTPSLSDLHSNAMDSGGDQSSSSITELFSSTIASIN